MSKFAIRQVLPILALAVILWAGLIFGLHRRDVYLDDNRSHDVEDYMQALLELKGANSEAFSMIAGRAAAGAVMIGTRESADACAAVDVKPTNFDLTEVLQPYLSPLPYDRHYNSESTGYYIVVHDSTLTVGACNTSNQEMITLDAAL